MTTSAGAPDATVLVGGAQGVLVWIDGREAVVVRWDGKTARIERRPSGVPAHHHSTGHVRFDPLTRHGGGGDREAAAERRRIGLLDRFVEAVADAVDSDDDVVLVGHGTVHERLEATLRARDIRDRRSRSIHARRADRATDRQLVAELRAHLGASPRRRRLST